MTMLTFICFPRVQNVLDVWLNPYMVYNIRSDFEVSHTTKIAVPSANVKDI